jgi:crotonobetainyl-CoA:carnitine CoA-transferase CaiB-like acyl-CoA transferase
VPPAAPRRVTARAGGANRPAATLVVDLSTLWAGPLCAGLVGAVAGLAVLKVEDPRRPDGARAGPPAFWDHLNGTKQHTTIEFTRDGGRRELAELLDTAAVVVTSARPRALDALSLDPVEHARRGTVWVAVTGYGLTGPWRDRVAFGDDAAVAGGAAVAAGGTDHPAFVLDAVADPLSGLVGAAAAVDALQTGRGAVIDVALRDVVAGALTTAQYAAQTDQEVA